jgi:ferric-dicitrate binding protein FerR (iron transport regulator)
MSDQSSVSPDALARLIEAAGRREAPPAQAYERALAAATEVWQAKVRRRRWRMAASLAAGIAAMGTGTFVALQTLDSQQPIDEPIANLARVIGAVRTRSDDSQGWTIVHESAGAETLPRGAVLRTEAGSGAALRIDDVSVRIAEDTEVALESRSRLRLDHGKVYVDTGSAGVANRMLVVSDAGSISDVGTQFEVQYRQGSYRVRVREGEVLLQNETQLQRGRAGEQLNVDASGTVSIAAISANDPAWNWVYALGTAPDIDNQPLTVLLAWVARETGVPVRYATPTIERRASATILHGSIRGLEPLQALTVMLATTDLHHEVLADGTIMIK